MAWCSICEHDCANLGDDDTIGCCNSCESIPARRQATYELEAKLAEAKAEIARLKSILNTMWTQG